MGKLKILFLTYHEVDYGLDVLYDGLCRVLGCENVLEYPTKMSLHSKVGRRWTWFPTFFDWPAVAGDDQKLDMLRRGGFDLILFSNRIYQLIKSGYKADIVDKYNKVIEIIKKGNAPIFILDQNDGSGLEQELIDILNARLYFKRDYLKDNNYDSKIKPLNFSYSEKYIPTDISKERTNLFFWVGKSWCGRTKYIKACKEIIDSENILEAQRTEIIYKQNEYSDSLLKSKIGLNLISYGYDSLRYYELPAHAVLLFSQTLPILIEYNFTDFENAVFFESIEDLKDKLNFLKNNENIVDEIRIKGHGHFLKYHTSKVRAQQLLNRIKNYV